MGDGDGQSVSGILSGIATQGKQTAHHKADLGLVGLFAGLVLLLGAGPVALVQLPTMAMAAMMGVRIWNGSMRCW